MEAIRRKTLLYKTGVGGMDYCINHVAGCSHGCRYPCYAFSMAHSYGRVKDYDAWCRPKLVVNALELLEKQLPRLKPGIRSVHLCFSTDPFMYNQPPVESVSLAIIARLNRENIPCTVLTKGILPAALADETRFSRANSFGISLVSLDATFRRRWEPGTAPVQERIAALRYLHDRGCSTWAHIEPYPTPNIIEQDVVPLLEAVAFVGDISFNGWNYNPLVRKYRLYREFYADEKKKVCRFCREHGINC